jgi:Leucine-rich repeat (LRR) protein
MDPSGKRRVQKVSLGGNNLMNSLPSNFFPALTELQVFGCAQNLLTGPLPADLAKATKLTEFEAYGNGFTGSIDVFGDIPNFSGRLDLHYNRFSGHLPPKMSASISYISVANNNITGSIPSGWSDLTKLTILGLANNRLTGTIPAFIGDYTGLLVLFLRNNSFAGEVPSLAKLQKLLVLDLDHNRLTSLPKDLCLLPAGVFSKSNCDLDWGGSDECCLSHNLFRCSANPIPPCARSCLAACASDLQLVLSDLFYATNGVGWANRSGWLTASDHCTWHGITCTGSKALAIKLSNNNLHGTIPASLGNITTLTALDFSGNRLAGTLPSSLGACSQLSSFSARNASLSGPFPKILSSLKDIQFLDLSHNALTGTLPAQPIDPNAGLEFFSVAHNQLAGEVPPALCKMPLHIGCHLEGNKFTGAAACSGRCTQ